MSVSLNRADFGELVDPFKGLSDLKGKDYPNSLVPHITFSDDPLRMLRAIRFAAQLGLKIQSLSLRCHQA